MEQKDTYKDYLERYKVLVAARNFHYENFNKWLTYFYVANSAIFIGYVSLLSDKYAYLIDHLAIPLLIFGFISGLLLYWSSKGYYYWNINFIMLVNHYEKNILKWKDDEGIYSIFANKNEQNKFSSPFKGANFSTSKIAILFNFLIASAWGSILFYKLIGLFCSSCQPLLIISSILFSCLFVILITLLFKFFKPLQSNVNPLTDLKITQ